MSTLRIGLLSDVHYGSDTQYQKGSQSPMMIDRFVEAMATFSPHLVVELGDRINNIDYYSDRYYLKELRRRLEHLSCPIRYVLGNHDLKYLSAEENFDVLGSDLCSPSFEVVAGNPLFFLNSEGPKPSDSSLPYIGKQRGGIIFVFSHRPLLPVPLEQNKLFARDDQQNCHWGPDLVARLANEGWKVYCLHGHLHWNSCFVSSSIVQLGIPSLVDVWETGHLSCSFGELSVSVDGIRLDIRGLLPTHYYFPWGS